MTASTKQIGIILALGSLLLIFGNSAAQQAAPPAPPNPYLEGSEGYDQGPRGLTSYQPDAIDRPLATRMAEEVAAKAAVEREHLERGPGLDRRVHVGEVPLVGRQRPVRVLEPLPAEHH